MRRLIPILILAMLGAACTAKTPTPAAPAPPGGAQPAAVPPRGLAVPPGFTISVFASGLRAPRHLAQGPDGAIYVAERGADRVSRLPDANADGTADQVEPYATGLEAAHSVEWHEGSLYVGATDGIYRFTPPVKTGDKGVKLVDLPARGGHYTRTVHFGPDGKMYVTIGSTCNVCIEEDPRRAAMWVYNADGTGGRLFAKGLRNTVDFAFHPQTGEIFGVDNGRDQLGDDRPPEELNLIKDGGDYGWPVCHGGDIIDPQFGKPDSCAGTEPPVVKMQAHSAPLGVQFYTGNMFPAEYEGRLFITFHGSWNRAEKTGYKVVSVPFKDGRPAGLPQDFLTGFLRGDDTVVGRPVGVLQTRDGALLVSDDNAGVIYRITYSK
jgi:glucose/arabinose dehydrogenase